MAIEIAPRDYWKRLTLADALLYCFSLTVDDKIGWRLPRHGEFHYIVYPSNRSTAAWYQSDMDDEFYNSTDILMCVPVRTKND